MTGTKLLSLWILTALAILAWGYLLSLFRGKPADPWAAAQFLAGGAWGLATVWWLQP